MRGERIAGLPALDRFEVLLAEWVIGHHLYCAVGRSGDDMMRLRLMLDEGGWLAFASYADANPTPDRLSTRRRFAPDSGLIEQNVVDDQFVFSAV